MSLNHNYTTNEISVDEIKNNFAAYLSRVEAGETLVITKAGKPIAEIKPVSFTHQPQRLNEVSGGDSPAPADFDSLLPMHIRRDVDASS